MFLALSLKRELKEIEMTENTPKGLNTERALKH